VSREGVAFDYSSPAELFLARRRGRPVSPPRLRPSITPSKNCAHSGLSPLGCRSVMSASTRTKSTDYMTMAIIRGVKRSDGKAA
jgi:hypothetical protein